MTTPFSRSASSTMMSRNSRSFGRASRERNCAAPLITPAGVRTSWASPAASSPTVAKCSRRWIRCCCRMFSTASAIPSRNGMSRSISRNDGRFSFQWKRTTATRLPRRKRGIEASNESSQIATSAAFDPPCSMIRSAGYRFVKREKARRYSSGRTGSVPIPSSVPPSGADPQRRALDEGDLRQGAFHGSGDLRKRRRFRELPREVGQHRLDPAGLPDEQVRGDAAQLAHQERVEREQEEAR